MCSVIPHRPWRPRAQRPVFTRSRGSHTSLNRCPSPWQHCKQLFVSVGRHRWEYGSKSGPSCRSELLTSCLCPEPDGSRGSEWRSTAQTAVTSEVTVCQRSRVLLLLQDSLWMCEHLCFTSSGYEESLTQLAAILAKHFADSRIVGTGNTHTLHTTSSSSVQGLILFIAATLDWPCGSLESNWSRCQRPDVTLISH